LFYKKTAAESLSNTDNANLCYTKQSIYFSVTKSVYSWNNSINIGSNYCSHKNQMTGSETSETITVPTKTKYPAENAISDATY